MMCNIMAAVLVYVMKTMLWKLSIFPRILTASALFKQSTSLKLFAKSSNKWPLTEESHLSETPAGCRQTARVQTRLQLEDDMKQRETRQRCFCQGVTWVASCQSNLGSHWHACGHRAVEIRVFNWTINLSAIGWRQSRKCNGFIFITGPWCALQSCWLVLIDRASASIPAKQSGGYTRR